MSKFKEGDEVIRTSGFYEDNRKDWTATIVDVGDYRSGSYTVKDSKGIIVTWRDVYFRKLTKLDKALK